MTNNTAYVGQQEKDHFSLLKSIYEWQRRPH